VPVPTLAKALEAALGGPGESRRAA
jgi:hypothetical protein